MFPSRKLTEKEKVMHFGKDTSNLLLSNVTVARIVLNVVTRHHIQKLMQVCLPLRTHRP